MTSQRVKNMLASIRFHIKERVLITPGMRLEDDPDEVRVILTAYSKQINTYAKKSDLERLNSDLQRAKNHILYVHERIAELNAHIENIYINSKPSIKMVPNYNNISVDLYIIGYGVLKSFSNFKEINIDYRNYGVLAGHYIMAKNIIGNRDIKITMHKDEGYFEVTCKVFSLKSNKFKQTKNLKEVLNNYMQKFDKSLKKAA